MEIKDYIRAVRRRFWLPLGLAVVAALATGGILYLQPAQYQAQAVVVVPALSAKGYSTSAVTQYFSTFKDVLVSAPVVDLVAKQAGVRTSQLVTGLTASTASASSNIINVTYTGTDRHKVPVVVHYAALAALDALMGPQLAAAQAAVNSSLNQMAQAQTALNNFTASTGHLTPDEEFRVKEAELSQLLVQMEEARLSGDTTRANGLQSIITTRQAELVALSGQVSQFQKLNADLVAAESVHNHALQQITDVNSMIASDHSVSAITVKDLGHVSKAPTALRFAAIAGALAGLLALGYLILMELIRPAGQVSLETVKRARRPAPAYTGAILAPGAMPHGSVSPVPTEAHGSAP